MSGVIRVPDLPDLGAVTDDTSLVAEHMGTGRIVATELRDYVVATGGGPYLPLDGGEINGTLSTGPGFNIVSGNDVYVAKELRIGGPGFPWNFGLDASGNKVEEFAPGIYNITIADGSRGWYGSIGPLMSLDATGVLSARTAVVSPLIHSTGNATIDGTLTCAGINAPSAPITTGAITATTVTASGGITTPGNVNATNINATGAVNIGGSDFHIQIDGSGNRSLWYSAGWALTWTASNGNLTYVRNGDGAALFSSIGVSGDFVIAGSNAYKPGGGSWTAPSDERIKTVVGDYTRGLADILQLQPKRFTYKGNDTLVEPDEGQSAPYSSSPNYIVAKDGREFAGLVAQELQPVIPEMCREYTGYIDGVVKSDMMTVDRSDLNLALVNAVKELEARVRALEAVRSAPATKAG